MYPVVLKFFRHRNAMTTAQVGNLFRGPMAATFRKCPSELVHFGLLETFGAVKGNAVYRVTPLTLDFLDGKVPVPEYVWPRDVELPKECVDGPLWFVRDMQVVHPGQDRAMHAEGSAQAL